MATLTRIASPEDDVGVTLLKDLKQVIQSESRMGCVSSSQMKYQDLGCNETSASLSHDGGGGIAMGACMHAYMWQVVGLRHNSKVTGP